MGGTVDEDQADVLFLSVGDDASGSPEQLERITLQLRRAIRELPVEAVDPVREQASSRGGKKCVDGAVIGALAIKLLPQVVPVLCGLLKKWIGGAPTRRLTVTCGKTKVEISGDLTPEQSAAILLAMTKATRHAG
jgi:hypothetical protein